VVQRDHSVLKAKVGLRRGIKPIAADLEERGTGCISATAGSTAGDKNARAYREDPKLTMHQNGIFAFFNLYPRDKLVPLQPSFFLHRIWHIRNHIDNGAGFPELCPSGGSKLLNGHTGTYFVLLRIFQFNNSI
jgi:hypothetical protein